jgi:signal transduction histidine kinase
MEEVKIPEDLIEEIINDNCVLFIGSGLSQSCGLPSWNKLIMPLAKKVKIALPKNETTVSSDKLLKIAQKYEMNFGRRLLNEHIFKNLDTTGIKPSNSMVSLTKLPINIWVTTNMDNLLEITLHNAGIQKRLIVQDKDIPYISSDAHTLIKLHGTIDQKDSYIITRNDYDTYFKKFEGIRNLMSFLIRSKTFLFIGYSLNDPDFNQINTEIAYELQEHKRKAYAFIVNPNQGDMVELKSKNIDPIVIEIEDRRNIEKGVNNVIQSLINQCLDKQTEFEYSRRIIEKNMIFMENIYKLLHRVVTPLVSLYATGKNLVEEYQAIFLKDIERKDINRFAMEIIDEIDRAIGKIKDKNEMIDTKRVKYKDLESNLIGLKNKLESLGKGDYLQIYLFDFFKNTHSLTEELMQGNDTQNIKEIRQIERKIEMWLNSYFLKSVRRMVMEAELINNDIETLRNFVYPIKEQSLEYQTSNIIIIINEAIEPFKEMALLKGIKFKILGNIESPNVEINRSSIRRAISNIIYNAVKFSYSSSKKERKNYIRIKTKEIKDFINIEIENIGVGILPDEIDEIFEYGKVGKLSRDWNRLGIGMGLFESKRIIENHNGKIWISSNPIGIDLHEYENNLSYKPFLIVVHITLPKKQYR